MIQDPNYKAWHNAYTEQHKHWPHGETSWQAGRDFEREKAQSALQAKEAEIAALKEDAERYRLLRRGQRWSVIDGIGNTLRAEELDAAIDSAQAAGDGEGKAS